MHCYKGTSNQQKFSDTQGCVSETGPLLFENCLSATWLVSTVVRTFLENGSSPWPLTTSHRASSNLLLQTRAELRAEI